MAETEVEAILREIRERVLAQQRAGGSPTAASSGGQPDWSGTISEGSIGVNGASESGQPRQMTRPEQQQAQVSEHISLINSYLTTTARAWDRLPPLVSNRGGFVARVELWLKRQVKRTTRWYAWEQINFNAAVHHALRDLLAVLSAYDAELRSLRAQLAAAEARETALKQYGTQLATQLNDLRAHDDRLAAQLAEVVNELRERDGHLRDEQRVCYKQLALETSEAAVLEDRARRQTEALLEELQRRLERLEKAKSDK